MRLTLLARWFAVYVLLVAGSITLPAAESAFSSLDLGAPEAPDLSLPAPKRSVGKLPLLQPPAKRMLAPIPVPLESATATSPKSNSKPAVNPAPKPKLSRPELVTPFLPGKLPEIYSAKSSLDLPIPPAPVVRSRNRSEERAEKPELLELLPTKEFPAAEPSVADGPTLLPEVPFLGSGRTETQVGTGTRMSGNMPKNRGTNLPVGKNSVLNDDTFLLPRMARLDDATSKPKAPSELPQDVPVLPPVASLRANTAGPVTVPPVVDLTAVAKEAALPPVASPDSLSTNLRLQDATRNALVGNGSQIQFDNDLPQLRVSTVGPDTLTVGKSARYTITLNNKSNFDAREVEVRCALPSWVKLDAHQASVGSVRSKEPGVIWNVDGVVARGEQQLSLDLIPQAGKAFELNVDITVQPSQSRKRIAIEEPMLAVALEGPESVVFNEPSTWQVSVNNPGSGDANDVVLEIFSGSRRLESRELGTVPAGGSAVAQLELTADEIGSYGLSAKASGDTIKSDKADVDFVCRRGILAVSVVGSEMDFVGSSTEYSVVLKNTGDAVSKNVLVDLEIPQGVLYRTGLANPTVTAGGVSWIVDQLGAGEEKTFRLGMSIEKPGDHELRATASSADQQTAENSFVIESLTSADLKLIVTDPAGPQPVGAIHEYTIDLTNRGSESAREITIIAVCPPEVEPVDVSGNAAIQSGQIFFKPIRELLPDHKVTYKVHARANEAGHHAFRVIVKCYEPNLRLASEESTNYFDRSRGSRGKSNLSRKSKAETGRAPAVVTQKKSVGPSF